MALVLGTNCGFVTTAPTADPDGTATLISTIAGVMKDISSATAGKITEIGWYCTGATQEANFEVGLYAADGAVVPGEAGTRLYIDDTNAKGTTAGWKRVTVDWDIEPNTAYWLALQLDSTATSTGYDRADSGGLGWDTKSATTLPNPFGGGAIDDVDAMVSVYAVWEAAPSGTNMKVNISDVFKDVSEIKINIGDVWKSVTQAKVNIGDAWKTIYG